DQSVLGRLFVTTFVNPARRRRWRRVIAPTAVLALGAGLLGAPPAVGATTAAEPTHTISQVQGTGDATPLAGQSVTVTGVVTAAYPTGGFRGFYLQEAGSGGTSDEDRTASAGVFVYAPDLGADAYPQPGDHVAVSGEAGEFNGLTQIRLADDGLAAEPGAVEPIDPTPLAFPLAEGAREAYEGMLVEPAGRWTVTDNYQVGRYGEIGLAAGAQPLRQATDVAAPGPDADAVEAANRDRAVTLDDGSSADYTGSASHVAVPWLTLAAPVTVGARATLAEPGVPGHRHGGRRFQPTRPLTGDDEDLPATFGDVRTPEPDPVGGDLTFATFNVL